MTREDDPEKYDYYFKKMYDAFLNLFYNGQTTKEAIESLKDDVALHIKIAETWEHVELEIALCIDDEPVWTKLHRKLYPVNDCGLGYCFNPPGATHDPRFYP